MAATVIFTCVVFNKISSRLGIPTLLVFILLGMVFGSDGLFKIPFDDYAVTEQICSFALIFIMFYGGFGTNWHEAKPVAVKAIILSSLGTVMTAGLVGLFCFFVLKTELLESFLIGSVISSTDAASVFSILRSKRLNLKHGTASLLELESGSNDPFSYMLTIIFLTLINGGGNGWNVAYMLFAQVAFGALFGFAVAFGAVLFLKKFKFGDSGFDAIFILGAALVAYAAPTAIGGNGYLSAYIAGIILGNVKIKNKQSLVHFFDGATGLMQMLLFFLLGLLASPSQLPSIILPALLIALFLTFVARPLAVFSILTPLRSKFNQQLLVSWAGMRGAASIVFAIMAMTGVSGAFDKDIFHIVFFIVLFSILLQGSLIPAAAKIFGMTDNESDVMKTFTDYSDEAPVEFIRFSVTKGHPWDGMTVSSIVLPPECILVLVICGGEKSVPNGKTLLKAGDTLILSGKASGEIDGVKLYEKTVAFGDGYGGKLIRDIPSGENLIIMVRRNESVIIPSGNTLLENGDVLVINKA